ncbi:MAG: hypothetical protein H6Q90_1149 [Deltaproteobacteria bacterium]|nr:hypothetical protein [Deltaproteobacteria bacterium]
MLGSNVRAFVLCWFVALCAVTAGAPTARAHPHDPHASYASVAGPAIVASTPRGTISPAGHGSAPDPRLAMFALPARPPLFVGPARTASLAPLDVVSLPFIAQQLSRSSRGPPI